MCWRMVFCFFGMFLFDKFFVWGLFYLGYIDILFLHFVFVNVWLWFFRSYYIDFWVALGAMGVNLGDISSLFISLIWVNFPHYNKNAFNNLLKAFLLWGYFDFLCGHCFYRFCFWMRESVIVGGSICGIVGMLLGLVGFWVVVVIL